MAVTIVATPGAVNANSFETEAEAVAYFNARLPLIPPWDEADDPTAALAMATRVLSMLAVPHRSLRTVDGRQYYYTSRQWTGTPATTTQALPWPRVGMRDRNGNVIPSNVIPQELKDAESELAGQLNATDSTLDNAVSVGGITSVKAGSVALTFKDVIESHVLPDAVLNLMPPSWFTDELLEPVLAAEFDVASW